MAKRISLKLPDGAKAINSTVLISWEQFDEIISIFDNETSKDIELLVHATVGRNIEMDLSVERRNELIEKLNQYEKSDDSNTKVNKIRSIKKAKNMYGKKITLS